MELIKRKMLVGSFHYHFIVFIIYFEFVARKMDLPEITKLRFCRLEYEIVWHRGR